ncbi:MAG: ATP-binding cassette domain-containing protein [Pseudomonadales bacterium]
MLQARDISLKRGDRTLFEHLSCTIHAGQKVGLVGRNGVGKSTLFQLFLGKVLPEDGDISMPSGWVVSHMAQSLAVVDTPALDYVLDGHAALRQVEQQIARAQQAGEDLRLAELHALYADLGGYEAEARAGEILHGLGFAAGDFQRPFRAFSGGWRIRLALARALMCPADLLLLDEPTNHLDLETTLWLEQWLQRFPGTLVLIAHDRDFLDGVTDHIIHLVAGHADTYRGNYSAFERQRAEQLTLQQAQFTRQQAQIEHIQRFVERFRAKASKARQVQSRLKALQRMETVAPVLAESPYRFGFSNPDKVSNPLLALTDVALGYAGRPVLTGIRQSILPGARIGVLGANGAGKSTLLKGLVGELTPLAGELVRGPHSRIGYFAQHQLETLDAGASGLAQIIRAAPGQREQWCRDYLGGWGFPNAQAERACGTYSGGERARLALALMALTEPALMVLDEPTNHLDLEMREALVVALQDYEGAVLLVSHDRSLLNRVVDEFWLVEGGRVARFDGDLDSYVARRELATPRRAPRHDRRAERQAAAQKRADEQPLRQRLRKAEQRMERLGAELKAVESRLADPELYHSLPAAELDELMARSGRLRRDLEAAEQDWLEASEQLETLNGSG